MSMVRLNGLNDIDSHFFCVCHNSQSILDVVTFSCGDFGGCQNHDGNMSPMVSNSKTNRVRSIMYYSKANKFILWFPDQSLTLFHLSRLAVIVATFFQSNSSLLLSLWLHCCFIQHAVISIAMRAAFVICARFIS